MTKPELLPDTPLTEFHCSAEWHLAKLSKAAALIYSWSLKISRASKESKEPRYFRVSPRQAAEYLKLAYRTVQLGYEELKRSGFFELVESGQATGEVSIYRPLTHSEWAAKHPSQCATKMEFPWTPENDLFGQQLFNITHGRINFKNFEIAQIRKSGRELNLQDQEIVEIFSAWYSDYKSQQEEQNRGKYWRKSVGRKFAQDYLPLLANILQQHPSQQVEILENIRMGRASLVPSEGASESAVV